MTLLLKGRSICILIYSIKNQLFQIKNRPCSRFSNNIVNLYNNDLCVTLWTHWIDILFVKNNNLL